jgi:hypothetical protein
LRKGGFRECGHCRALVSGERSEMEPITTEEDFGQERYKRDTREERK